MAAEVLVRDQPIYVENIGQTLGEQDVEIRARVAGFLGSVNFVEGTFVTNGTLLYTIDDAPFKAALAQARGGVAQAEASWQKAIRDTNRLGPLWEKNAIARQQFDDALAAELGAGAVLESARAAMQMANIQLEYTRIYAPIDGIVGKTEVAAGNLVGQGQPTLLTTLSTVDPIHVRFSISERDYLAWRRKAGTGATSQDEARGVFELILADGERHPFTGDIAFADRQIDSRTGTLLLQVAFPNPDRIIRPGQFGRVRFVTETLTNAVLVPQWAVQELQANYSVFVVNSDNTVQFRKVNLGPQAGRFRVVNAGLQAGDIVVIEGIQKLYNNAPVTATLTDLAMEANGTGQDP